MRILVLGGTGFIGSHVSRQLAEAGHDVCVFHRGQTAARLPNNVRYVRSEAIWHSSQIFPSKVVAFSPDAIIHMIAMTQRDAETAMSQFRGHAGRIVAISSGDVYLAYARFTRFEPGEPVALPLKENSPLRTKLYPYRSEATSPEDMRYDYDKILVERACFGDPTLPGTVLRLPKVYGAGRNADFATVHRYRNHSEWRWTHGYVENVAHAIVLAATHPAAVSKVFNVGEPLTPTIAQRSADIPPSNLSDDDTDSYDFSQDIVYDTEAIRRDLGFVEPVQYEEGIQRTICGVSEH
jgi:nucleoside-diphosphate-sugar epimerase